MTPKAYFMAQFAFNSFYLRPVLHDPAWLGAIRYLDGNVADINAIKDYKDMEAVELYFN